ncbi:hypothetical protein M9458_019230, partial [Cirrhinus mrigala]
LLRQLHLPGMFKPTPALLENHLGMGKYIIRHPTSPCKSDYFIRRKCGFCIILGCPWLCRHHPELRWDPCDVTRWSKQCHTQCLSNLPHPRPVPVQVASTHVESPEPAFTPEISAEYAAFQYVFSKQAATQLPPHRPWDCAIDFFFVGKKDGGLHPCIDYWQLNSQILQQAALEELHGARVFMKLDLRSAYKLVRIRAGDEWKTAFVTPTRHYEYWVMLYGLSISPSVFQMFMNEVFLHFVVVYTDDILIYSRDLAEHRQHVQQVLHKLEKCKFHQPSVQFLGYVISAEGVQMDQGKVNAIQEWPQPCSVKELQRFLGFPISTVTSSKITAP